MHSGCSGCSAFHIHMYLIYLDLQWPTLDVLLTVQPRTPLGKLSLSLGEWVIQHKCLTMPAWDDRKDRVVSSDGREVMQFLGLSHNEFV